MKRVLKMFFGVVVPVVSLVLGAVWYQGKSQQAMEYQKNYQLLKAACQESSKTASADANGVCGCFAKTALKHRSISLAGIVNDQDIVQSILRDCSRRVPASKSKKN